ncbi:hypothetical protein VN12_05935 [Pirellula sp. SH-Sr6A]|uniref:hypothetical protein n=1 Tax=Pirellula sp. SH-Sr6A TaxID=1632865 RepID=UPI00078EF091|nr:hypothetical protein [Pirellula sp. SH-Sr6A]AMV31640.1 hypothetical protein VN12_05935 [Pirellula sp. SH-Sr6A]
MLLAIAVIVVVVLLAVALIPVKKREPEQLKQASPVAFLTPEPAQPVRQTTLRQQQLDEEANAVASEYQRRADAVWLDEVRTKASKLLGNTKAKAES